MSELDPATPGNAEDTAPQQTADTPTEGTGTQDQPQIPAGYIPEDRYKEAQAWATRAAQEAAQLRERTAALDDYEQFVRHGREQGWLDVGEQTGDTLYEDPQAEINTLREQVQQLSEWQHGLTEQQQQEQQMAQYRALVDPQLTQMGIPDPFIELVADIAANMPAVHTPQGPQPDLAGAVAEFNAFAASFADYPETKNKVLKTYAGTKSTSHRVSPVGEAGSQVPDLDDRQARIDYMTQRVLDSEQQ